MKKFCYLLFIFCYLSPAFANNGVFDLDRWYTILNEIQNTAIAEGVSARTINQTIQPSVFIPGTIKSDKNQAEFKLTMDEYLARTVNSSRIANGQKMMNIYPTLLSRVNQKYGVPPHIILAFWGMESNYGQYTARYKLTDAFLSLIYDGRRETFFKQQLIATMKSADKSGLNVDDIRGSWAGAMGHFQFIPTTLAQYGADGNGDGKIDIINNISDAMFSSGNYLNKLGWDKNERIVRRVQLPDNFDTSLCDGKIKKTLDEWRTMGVVGVPYADMIAGIVCDYDKVDGPGLNGQESQTVSHQPLTVAYLTYPNFYRIKKWNNSNWYAVAIALLADKIKG